MTAIEEMALEMLRDPQGRACFLIYNRGREK